MTAPTREIMAPVPSPETEKFWAAARDRRLLVGMCHTCEKHHFYPRSHCPHCLSEEIEWRDAAGTGTIYSVSVMRRASVPYAMAYVELAEGPKMLANVVNCDLDRLAIGQRVRLTFVDFDQGTLPAFEPAD
ncbi:Zn-ribbon domain-containing OB-fold protein [Mesorhizobium sp. 1B3]|uniref:Zn-ribbon domain-containing OB-fold protein n=1 Tax=Mesorhizobium sp. 1B3 TaxID=3243599 RepID=UPI003D972B8E